MATKTIARPRTPVASEDNAQHPADLLENTLSQLEALLCVEFRRSLTLDFH